MMKNIDMIAIKVEIFLGLACKQVFWKQTFKYINIKEILRKTANQLSKARDSKPQAEEGGRRPPRAAKGSTEDAIDDEFNQRIQLCAYQNHNDSIYEVNDPFLT